MMAFPDTRSRVGGAAGITIVVACTLSPLRAAEPLPAAVEFNRDIRPILADHCFPCHGPDQARRKAHLRLDTEEGAFADRDGAPALVRGDPARSELFRRITAEDDKDRMPPARAGRRLTSRQIDLVHRWIEQGARWQPHWSFLAPQPPAIPAVKNAGWARSPIDRFILDRLQREGLSPSPEADRATLIRRVTLDLTGLPPTPAEVDAFLADGAPDAYERVVERLLQSPRYGERLAGPWLDAARYADTNGYQSDGERTMWRWRDWVIAAYNRNQPFDRFTVEQLAGDLLPGATLDQRIATGFNRNHRGNAEGGIIPEEYAVEYVVDRVDTTATVWLGLTLGCARCHDHKFDPFTQREYYRLFAYFNNVPEKGKAIKYGNSPPVIQSPTPRQQEQLRDLERRLAEAAAEVARLEPGRVAAQARWERSIAAGPPLAWAPADGLAVHFPLDGDTTEACGHTAAATFRDGEAAYVPGKIGWAADFDGRRYLDAGNVAAFGFYDKFSLGAWIYPRGARGGTVISRMHDAAQDEGYRLGLDDGKVTVQLVKRWLDDAIRVETVHRLPADGWHHVLMTYDGSRVAVGVKVYVDGKPEPLRVVLDDLNQSFATSQPLRIGGGGGPGGRFHGAIDDVRIYHDALPADVVELLATTDAVNDIAALPPAQRGSRQASKIRACFLDGHAPAPIQQAHRSLTALRKAKDRLVESFPTTMVMEEMATPRETFVLRRGAYDQPGEQVSPGVPASLPPLPAGVPNNRLGFARWVVDPANPLTARVAVNRLWQLVFGTGLVRTVDDFGAQGEWPTHPELLDWLAIEFVRTGWDVKALLRTIVTSATYRQSSKVTPALLQRDPDNRLLARGPRFRLPADMVRDGALAVSGLLVEEVGGPSVRPYQPAGLWKELADTTYRPDQGRGLYRRSLYTFWKRTVPPPAMMTFDAAGREACVVRQTRTNTPLQALTLMNDVTYAEAARVLAQRVLTEGGTTPRDRLRLAFRLATGRRPRPVELHILLDGFRHHLAGFRQDPAAARKLVHTGEFPVAEQLDISELAAYTTVAGLILNLDETITKE